MKRRTTAAALVLAVSLAGGAGCKSNTGDTTPPDTTAGPTETGEPGPDGADAGDDATVGEGAAEAGPSGGERALAVYEALQAKIDAETDSKGDRKQAHESILEWDDGSVAYAFARAALAGRRAQAQGLKAGGLVEEAETYARRVLEQEPGFRDGAATRLLGSLYVLAPGRMVKHGDSETGLEMLEKDVETHGDRADARLRLAEAYVALDDPEPGYPHLCFCLKARDSMGGEDQRILDKLVEDVGGAAALGCGG